MRVVRCPRCGRSLTEPAGMTHGPYYATSLDSSTGPSPTPLHPNSSLNTAFWVMALASVSGVLIEFARYRRESDHAR